MFSKMVQLINRDDKLLALVGGMLLDGLMFITLIVYVSMKLIS